MENPTPRARLYYLFGSGQSVPNGSPWLARLPAGVFAIPVGLLALAGAWQRAGSQGWELAAQVARVLLWSAALVWLATLLLYGFKCKRHFAVVVREFRHPVQGSLQALLPLSVLLAAIQFRDADPAIALAAVMLALTVHAIIGFRVVSVLATGQMPSNAVTPALYIPVVGGALVGAMALAALQYPGWAALLFGTGLSGWALLEARILGKLFEGPLPENVRATIGVELAPPAIATLAASMVWPQLPGDVLVVGLGVAIAPFVGVFARIDWWTRVPFSLGFWSFSFPAAAFAAVVLEVVHRGRWPAWIGHTVLLLSSAVIAFLTLRTIILLARGRFLPPE